MERFKALTNGVLREESVEAGSAVDSHPVGCLTEGSGIRDAGRDARTAVPLRQAGKARGLSHIAGSGDTAGAREPAEWCN